jgi:SAM-dependent methyltransferase
VSSKPIKAENERRHGQYLAANDPEAVWGWGTLAGKWRANRRAELIAQGANLRPGMRVLEIGCGSGMFTAMFAQTGAQLIAVDISPDLIALAKARKLPSDQVRFFEKRFEDCDVDGPFDAIIGSSVLHHLEINAAVSRIRSLLKPGGVMSFAEPNMLNPQVFLERTFRQWFPYVSPDEIALVRSSFRKQLIDQGFTDVAITPFDWLHPATPDSTIGLVQAVGWWFEQIPGVKEFAGSLYIQARTRASNI